MRPPCPAMRASLTSFYPAWSEPEHCLQHSWTLRHSAQRLDSIALERKHDIFFLERRFDSFHVILLSFIN